MAANHVGEMFAQATIGAEQSMTGGKGMGFGLTVRVVVDRVAAASALNNGSFGWSGAFGTHFWVDRSDRLVGILLIQEPVNAMRPEFENAVVQAIVD